MAETLGEKIITHGGTFLVSLFVAAVISPQTAEMTYKAFQETRAVYRKAEPYLRDASNGIGLGMMCASHAWDPNWLQKIHVEDALAEERRCKEELLLLKYNSKQL